MAPPQSVVQKIQHPRPLSIVGCMYPFSRVIHTFSSDKVGVVVEESRRERMLQFCTADIEQERTLDICNYPQQVAEELPEEAVEEKTVKEETIVEVCMEKKNVPPVRLELTTFRL